MSVLFYTVDSKARKSKPNLSCSFNAMSEEFVPPLTFVFVQFLWWFETEKLFKHFVVSLAQSIAQRNK